MNTQNPTKQQAIEAYKKADAAGKKLLQSLWGKETFETPYFMPKTFEEACKKLALNPKTVLPFKAAKTRREEVGYARMKLDIIAEAMQGSWSPNWDDCSEYKYYPWFDMRKSSGLSYCGYVDSYSVTTVGSRLCFPTSELAKHFGTQFISLHKIVLTK